MEGYKIFQNSSSGYGAFQSETYIRNVEKEIEDLKNSINQFEGFMTPNDKLKGDLAEFWHSGTHNIDAAVKGAKERTWVYRSHEFASPDILSTSGKKYGVKYYKNGSSSAKAQSMSYFERYMEYKAQTRSEISFSDFLRQRGISENDVLLHDPIYQGQVRIIPKEQLEAATDFLKKKIAEEASKRPELVKKYSETLNMLEIKIKSGKGSESIPLTEAEARKLAELAKKGDFDPVKYGFTIEELIKFEYILQQSLKAGISAATISVVLRVAPELFAILNQLINTGEIDKENFKKIGLSAVQGGAEGFIRGSISAGLTTACISGQFGETLKAIDPAIIGAVTIIVLNTIQNSYKLARNQMSKAEFVDACMRDIFVTTCSLTVGGITQGLIEIPVIGYLIGSFIGSIAASFIYDNVYKSFISFCCETGFTFFGLVDQNYTLPSDILKEMGVKTFEYEKFRSKTIELKKIQPKQVNLKSFYPKTLEISFIRRGVIGINKIGYVS
jgi:hypothetical protein